MIYQFTQKAADHPAQFLKWAERRGSPHIRCFVFGCDLRAGRTIMVADFETATVAMAAGWITKEVV